MQTGSRTGGGQKGTPSSAAAGKLGIIQSGSAPPPRVVGSQWGGSETSVARQRERVRSGLACAA